MMNIKYGQTPIQLSQDGFNKLDYKVMGSAFDLHNEMGNLWDEKEYQHELAVRCAKQGFETFTEVSVAISHNGFTKTYFIDLLVNGSIYELKTASVIADSHVAQTLNYLFLTETQHGKIINFSQDSLTWRFVSTTLNHQTRLNYSLDTTAWNSASELALTLLEAMQGLLANWGACLSISLYREALCYLVGALIENEHQRFIPLSTTSTLHVSGLSSRNNNLRNNLQKHLNHSSFSELLWINFNQNKIEFCSLNHSA